MKCIKFKVWNISNYRKQAFIQALLSTAVFPQRFSFFTFCLVHNLREHQRKNFWNLGLRIAGKYISDILSNCRRIACTPLINMVFFREYQLRIPPYYHVCLFFFVCRGSDFYWNFRVLWGVSKKTWVERYIQLFFMRV